MVDELYKLYVEVRECTAAMNEHEEVCVLEDHDQCHFYTVVKITRDQADKALRIHDEEVARIRQGN